MIRSSTWSATRTSIRSPAAFHKFVARNEPELFEGIRARIAEGRWEIVGGWGVEPDCNVPSGESFARHVLYTRPRQKRDAWSWAGADPRLIDLRRHVPVVQRGLGATPSGCSEPAARCGARMGYSPVRLRLLAIRRLIIWRRSHVRIAEVTMRPSRKTIPTGSSCPGSPRMLAP